MTQAERPQDKQDAAEVKNYTRTPNMLIFGYPDVSPQEKWLYVCLKHMCGKSGTRYLALRYISEQTGISTGALSKSKNKQGVVNEGMIRHLHDAGLIHAEVKKKEGRGNALYHITITDVWALNQQFFIERTKTRSDFGQDEEETSEPVRISDAPVHLSDKLVQNSDAPVRKPVQLQDIYKTTTKTIKQEGVTYDSAVATSSPALSEEEYVPDLSLGKPTKAEHEYMEGQVVGALVVVNSLEAQQDSYSPVSGSDYEKTGEEDGNVAVALTGVHGTDIRTGHAASEQSEQGHNRGQSESLRSVSGAAQSNRRSGDRSGQAQGESGSAGKAAEQPTLVAEKKPMTLEAQIDAAFQVLEHLKKNLTEKPFGYTHTKIATNKLRDLIKENADTPNRVCTQNITLAYNAMWNEPTWSNGKSWRDTGMLSVAKFCEHYEKYLEIGREATAPKQSKPSSNPERGVSGLGKWVPPAGMQAALAQQGDRR